MTDRQKLNNGKSSIIKTPTLPSTYAEFKTACESGLQYIDINPNDVTSGANQGVSEVGTPLDVATLLSNTTAQALGLTNTATPNDAFAEIANAIDVVNTITIATSDWVANGTGYKAVKTVNDMKATSKPIPALHFTQPLNDAQCKLEQRAYTNVRMFETAEDQITVYASGLPATAISIDLRGI